MVNDGEMGSRVRLICRCRSARERQSGELSLGCDSIALVWSEIIGRWSERIELGAMGSE